MKFLILIGATIGILSVLSACKHSTTQEQASTKEIYQYNENKIWDRHYLLKHPEVAQLLSRFAAGNVCSSLKDLDTKTLSHAEIIKTLEEAGYICNLKPLKATPDFYDSRILRKDGTLTLNSNDKNIAWQQTCILPKEGCVVRIKPDGFPGSSRNYPHSIKAILTDPKGLICYDNEALKITYHGKALPKSTNNKFGLAPCPYGDNKDACHQWIKQLVEDTHPLLKSPIVSTRLAK